jgi:hypothetical protein
MATSYIGFRFFLLSTLSNKIRPQTRSEKIIITMGEGKGGILRMGRRKEQMSKEEEGTSHSGSFCYDVSGGPEALFCYFSPLPPLRGQPAVKYCTIPDGRPSKG